MLLLVASVVAFPLSRYVAWIMDGKYRPWRLFGWFERRLDTGQQSWKEYTASLLISNMVLFAFSFIVLMLQPWMPLNPRGLGMLAPSTIFNSAVSFMTNADLLHYSGEQHLSNFSQIFFCFTNLFLSASVGMSAFVAIIRALRGDEKLGNYFLDIWRAMVYMLLPAAVIVAFIFMVQGVPMTYQSSHNVHTLEATAMGTTDKGEPIQQTIVVGPVAAFESIELLGTNGGGFYAMNSAHPFENPTGLTNFLNCLSVMIFPFALVFTYGRMLGRMRHAFVIFYVMLALMAGIIVLSVSYDTLAPNAALTAHPEARAYEVTSATAPGGKVTVTLPAVAGLPIDQHLGNLEGKEMRLGTSAGAASAALMTGVTVGAPSAELDSLNPSASLSPMIGMWLGCIFGGKGVGMISMLLYVVIGIFIAGMMVGRTPEYLGKKLEAREVKLAIIALMIHPFMILMPSGLFAATSWGLQAVSNPGPHGLSQIIYQFSSASATNGSAFDGLRVAYGFADNASPAPTAVAWDIATGLILVFSRFVPIIASLAMAASLGAKRSAPFGVGTLRTDTPTFGFLLVGTILIIGALVFLPLAVLGPVAEHLGPIPFGG
jgi:K+-transporting ATPase ATPase A chain